MPEFHDTRILVVGGAGFVGSNLCRLLLAENPAAIDVVDNLLSSERENLPDDRRIRLTVGSIAEDAVLKSLPADGYDYVFHLATYHGNQSSMHDPIADHDNNLLTTLKLLDYIKNWKGRLRKVVYSGAGCAVAEKTYDSAKPTTEEAAVSLDMDSPYSISKIVGEFYCVYYHRQHEVPAVRARFQNVYGPGEVLGAGRWRGTPASVWRNVTPAFIYRALHGEALPLEGEGRTTRDFIFVEDIARGLMCCALKGKPGDVYHLASGSEVTIASLADRINTHTQNAAGVKLLPRRTWDHSGCRYGSPEKAKRELGFEVQVSFDEGIRRTVEWTKATLPRIESSIAKHSREMEAFNAQPVSR